MEKLSKIGMLRLCGMLLVAGCSRTPSIPNPLELVAGPATIHVGVPAKPGAIPMLRAGQTVSLAVADFADARPGAPGRKVGDIRATVSNMHVSELVLDQDIPALLGSATRNQLGADGFRLVGAGETADFRLSGVTRAFSLNIAGRDEHLISVEATLREGKSGEIVWAGVITEKGDRFAGVNGNSRATIIEYLGEGVSEFAWKVSAAVRDSLAKSYPQSIVVSQMKSISSVPGVTTLHAPTSREKPAATREEAPKPAAAPLAAPVAGANVSYFSVHTSPSRAKVYVDDVYYGMSPLKIEVPVGVSLFRFKLDGYKTVTEKVSVRRGETTELEVKFEK
ncbi:MAG: PEGA domain-containing protein [Burkholderiales bacterium]|nr:PEGA domain-containing protein [Burkholderiales bacterium]